MKYLEITKTDKQNISFPCTPFCIERDRLTSADSVHVHNYHQLTIVTHGNANLIVNNFSCKVNAGSVYVVSNYAPHHLESANNLEVVNILFNLDDLMQHAGSLQQNEGFRSLFVIQASTSLYERPSNILKLSYEGIQEILHLIDMMLEELNKDAPGQDIVIQSYFMILITYLSRQFDVKDERNQDPYAFYLLIEHINQNFSQNYTLSDLTRISSLNERLLRSMFMKKYHCSPMQYITHVKMEKAKYYLITSDMNITEIADACGYDDSNYFSRKFKQEFGVSPRDFKKTL